MEKLYERINFENAPSTKTPLNEENMNKMDSAIYGLDNRVVELSHFINPKVCVGKDYPNLIINNANDIKLFIPAYTGWIWKDRRCEVTKDATVTLIPAETSVLCALFVKLPSGTAWTNTVTASDFLAVPHTQITSVDSKQYRYIGFIKNYNSTFGGPCVEMGGLPCKHNGKFIWDKQSLMETTLISPPYTGFVTLDTTTGVFSIPETTYYTSNHGRYNPPTGSVLSVNVSNLGSSDVWVFFDWNNKQLYAVAYSSVSALDVSRYSYVCSIRYGRGELTMIDLSIPYMIDGKWFGKIAIGSDAEPTQFSYIGEKIPSKVNHFDSAKVFTMSGSGITSQDTEIYGNYYFVACSQTEQIRVYSLETNTLLANMLCDVQHGSGMQFSGEFYESTDEFPLLYVGGYSTNFINVVRITKTSGTWSASVVRTIYIPTTHGYWFAPSVDAKSNILYAYGYKANHYRESENAMKLLRLDLNNLTNNDDGTYTPGLISECETPYLGVTQGRKFYGGNLYVAFANVASPFNARLVSIDGNSGVVKADVDLTGVTKSEAEGLCYKIDGNQIYWYLNDYWDVFKLSF